MHDVADFKWFPLKNSNKRTTEAESYCACDHNFFNQERRAEMGTTLQAVLFRERKKLRRAAGKLFTTELGLYLILRNGKVQTENCLKF